ncbi:MAG: LacI family transcriptional regulator, partial [Rubrobacteraceae bacterium]
PGVAEQALRAVEAADRQDIVLATFDISRPVLEAVRDGNVLFAIDQQMFLQTYLSILSLVTHIQYRLAPVAAAPTGPAFITDENAGEIIELAGQGIH